MEFLDFGFIWDLSFGSRNEDEIFHFWSDFVTFGLGSDFGQGWTTEEREMYVVILNLLRMGFTLNFGFQWVLNF